MRQISLLKGVLRSRMVVVGVCYVLVALALFQYAERTMPIGAARLVVTVALVLGFLVAMVLAWVLKGILIRRRAMAASGEWPSSPCCCG